MSERSDQPIEADRRLRVTHQPPKETMTVDICFNRRTGQTVSVLPH